MNKMKTSILVMFLILVSGYPITVNAESASNEYKPAVVFAVRHAEKMDNSKDPELSVAGKERAEALANLLMTSGIEYIHSSPYIRTRETAAPAANQLGLVVKEYDPRDLPTLVDHIRTVGGRHLVVGHSNTTPQLAELLGDDSTTDIHEKSEYDRIYVITIDAEGTATSILLRYGIPFIEKPKS